MPVSVFKMCYTENMKNCLRKFKIYKYGFTLAEVLITLVVVGVVAAMTIPTLIARYEEQVTVAKVQKAYSTVAQAWKRYQMDYGCVGAASLCIEDTDSHNNNNFMNRFIKYFNSVERIPVNTSLSNVDWLPDKAYCLDGSLHSNDYWMGVYNSGNSYATSFFTLADGTIYHIQFPDNGRKSGFIFFDTNGKKGPNRIGKDQFPIGIGANNNPEYEGFVHPYYAEDNENTFGLCAIRNNGQCSPDVCTQTSCSPTAYVLKHKKLPPINW